MIKHVNKYIVVLLAVIQFLSGDSTTVFADVPVMPEVLVTSQRSGRFLNSRGAETTVITRKDIQSLHLNSIPELLETVASIDIRERGTPGSQADISVRGSSFEGVLLLVNGIRYRDPQTGHFTMDIPLDLASIERVEVLSGGGSTMYGSTASGGVINIVTGNDPSGTQQSVSIGSYGSLQTNAGLGFSMKNTDILLRVHGKKSDGYIKGTDIRNTGIDVSGSHMYEQWTVDWNMGIINKRFGAEGFYAPYPSYEETLTLLGGVNAQHVINPKSMLRFRAGARGHGDDFILVKDDPGFYRNTHYNRSLVFSGEYINAFSDNYTTVIGVETERTGISSGSLGRKADNNNAVYGEFTADTGKARLSASLRYDSGFRNENYILHGVGIEIPLGNHAIFKVRTEKSFRSPTYTELYYTSPANVGNSSLKSQRSQSVEAGFHYTGNFVSSGITVFARESTDVIDWIREEEDAPWKTENHGRTETTGIELKLRAPVYRGWESRLTALLLDQTVERQKGVESKYVLNPAARVCAGTLAGPLPAGIRCSFRFRYETLLDGDEKFPVSVSCSKPVKSVRTVFSVKNMFNEQYEEFPGLRAPGRWYTLQLEFNL